MPFIIKNNFISKKELQNDIFRLLGWMGLMIIFIYFTNPILKTFFLLFILFQFFICKSDDDYFWIILVLVLVDYPVGLFRNTHVDVLNLGIIKFDFIELFSIVALIKISSRRNYLLFPALLKKPYLIYLFWLVFLMTYGAFFVGISGGGKTGFRYIYYFIKAFFLFPLFYSLPKLVNNDKKLIKLSNLLFFLVILNIIGQIIHIVFKVNLHSILSGELTNDLNSDISMETMVRATSGSYTNLFSLLLASYFYFYRQKFYKKKYLTFILAICFLSITITASRGWIVAFYFFFATLMFIPLITKSHYSIFIRFIFILLPIVFILLSTNILSKHLEFVFERLQTLNLILEGDLTAGGTNVRLTTRSYPVMKAFYESPVIGWGFSGKAIDTWDGHVGNQSILMVSGVIGLLIIIYVLFYIIVKFLSLSRHSIYKAFKSSNVIVVFFLLCTIIIHSSAQGYGYFLYARSESSAFTRAFLFALIASLYYFDKFRQKRVELTK